MSSEIITTARLRTNKRDYRMGALVLAIGTTLVLGYLINLMPGKGVSASPMVIAQPKLGDFSALQSGVSPVNKVVEETLPVSESVVSEQPSTPEQAAIQSVLALAQEEILAERYDLAIATLHVAHQQLKQVPQAYLQMGQALQGKKELEIARDFYNKATDMDPFMAEGYLGFATTSEELGDLEAAIGGMRNFLHVQPNADPQKLKIVQARSAIWEWESQLGRGPWGPTKGIPPDLTADQIKRDGQGVAIKMPFLETKDANGNMKYEIKHAEKTEIFKR